MKNIVLLIFCPFLTAAYNLEVQNVIIFEDPRMNTKQNEKESSYFGYSVLLTSKKLLFVGAPKANYTTKPNHSNNKIPKEPGIVYRCSFTNPYKCIPINVTNPDDEIGFIDQVAQNTLIEKGYSWFGAAMSFHEPTDSLTVCAPRTIVRIYSSSDIRYQNTMHGVCYNGNLTSGNLDIEDKNLSTYDFDTAIWHNPLNGFAVHYPTPKSTTTPDVIHPIIGSPKHQLYGSVHKMGQHKTAELPTGDDLNQFGYALTSGYYFHEQQLMVAAGAPGWQYLGQVAVMDPRTDPLSIIATINGKEVGEYFGSSLTTGDINNDGLDDLIVGAPHWNNDNGRVHIFLGNKAGFFEADVILEGKVDDALFGYAITSGDLDGDGFDDLIIGAPWEEFGVIYVYNGEATFRELRLFEPSQRISALDLRKDIRQFGFSLSKPLDIDGNNLADIAVGAYASGHVMILRSKPIVITDITISTFPKTLLRNSTIFVLRICVDHISARIDGHPFHRFRERIFKRGFRLDITVDEDYKRVGNVDFAYICKGANCYCSNRTINLKTDNRNYVDVIQIVAKHTFIHTQWNCAQKMNTFDLTFNSNLCPTSYKTRDAIAQTKLSFDIGCGLDEICRAFIRSTLIFQGIRNSTWIIGSNDLRLELQIINQAEPAYLTTVTVNIPSGINLRSILPFCQEEEISGALRVTCDVGNPLETKKTLILDLDMNNMRDGSTDGTTLNFNAEIKTRSINSGNSTTSIKLHLKANVSVSLSGKASDNSYYLKNNERPTNLTFQHAYQISKFGETPISMAFLTILVPFKRDGLEFLTIGQKPRIFILGGFYECSMTNLSVAKPRFFDKSSTKANIENGLHLNTIADHLKIRRASFQDNFTSVIRTDTNSHKTLNYSTDSESYKNAQPQIYTLLDSANIDITYVNCSTPGVTCGQIFCMISALKTAQDVGKLQIQMIVNNSILAGGADNKEKVIHITTEAFVEIVDPKMSFVVSGTGFVVPVTTTLYHAPIMNSEISIWIILGSMFLGILTLWIIAIALWKIGFFNRSTKEDLNNLKKGEDVPLHCDSFAEDLDDTNDIFI